jgi:hypothetical protein
MKQFGELTAGVICALVAHLSLATAQTGAGIPPAITTPDKVETRIGLLDFKDGAPSNETLDKIYNNIDFTHALARSSTRFRASASARSTKGFWTPE